MMEMIQPIQVGWPDKTRPDEASFFVESLGKARGHPGIYHTI